MPYQTIFNHTYEFTLVLDQGGTIQYVNDSALEFGGVTRDDVIGKKFWETDLLSWSDRVQQQVRADVKRAATGELVRHELEVQGEERGAIVDFSLRPFTNESGEKTWLLAEGRDITELGNFEGVSPRVPLELSKDDLLVTYAWDSEQPISQSIIDAFLALDINIFERDTQLEDWIDSDAIDRMAWCSERPLTLITRIWGYNVVLSGGDVRIYADT